MCDVCATTRAYVITVMVENKPIIHGDLIRLGLLTFHLKPYLIIASLATVELSPVCITAQAESTTIAHFLCFCWYKKKNFLNNFTGFCRIVTELCVVVQLFNNDRMDIYELFMIQLHNVEFIYCGYICFEIVLSLKFCWIM